MKRPSEERWGTCASASRACAMSSRRSNSWGSNGSRLSCPMRHRFSSASGGMGFVQKIQDRFLENLADKGGRVVAPVCELLHAVASRVDFASQLCFHRRQAGQNLGQQKTVTDQHDIHIAACTVGL